MSQLEKEKEIAGKRAANLIKDNQTLGVGSGTTVSYFIKYLSERVKSEKLNIEAVPSSYQTYYELLNVGIPITSFDKKKILDATVDGADEVDENLNLIKGGGGALTQEKIIGTYTKKLIIIIDSSKYVKKLGGSPLPIEVLPQALIPIKNKLEEFGGQPDLRIAKKKLGPVITDNGNFIIDCKFREISNPKDLERKIKMLPGVLENGLFVDLTSSVIIAKGSEIIERTK